MRRQSDQCARKEVTAHERGHHPEKTLRERLGGSKEAVACSTGKQRTCLCEIVFFEARCHAHVRHVGT